MIRRIAAILIVIALVHAATFSSDAQRPAGSVTFPTTALTIRTSKGEYDFKVELALKPDQQAQGLMYRRRLDPDAGMLFIYEPAQPVSMWMKNTLIPLDMVFIDNAGKVTKIAERTVPLSLKTISSGSVVSAVLELNSGTASRIGLKPGDEVRWNGH